MTKESKIYTSKEMSIKLKKAGFVKDSETYYMVGTGKKEYKDFAGGYGFEVEIKEKVNYYDILNDLCVKYREELFGKLWWEITSKIFTKISFNETQKEIEDYIIANSVLFNK